MKLSHPAYHLRDTSSAAAGYAAAQLGFGRPSSAIFVQGLATEPRSRHGQALDIAAWARQYTRQFAAQLGLAHRERLFRQLDLLHDTDDWEEGDQPLRPDSYRTFIRLILMLQPTRWPSLGMTYDGYLTATWRAAEDRITIECLGEDRVRFVLSSKISSAETDRSAGTTSVSRLFGRLSNYQPDRWFHAG